MRNNINLAMVLGLMVLSIGISFFGTIGLDVFRNLQNQSGYHFDFEELMVATLSVAYLIVGFMLLGKMKSAEKITYYLFITSIVAWTIFIVLELFPELISEDIEAKIGLTIFIVTVYILLFAGIFFLRDERVKRAFGKDTFLADIRDDILDD